MSRSRINCTLSGGTSIAMRSFFLAAMVGLLAAPQVAVTKSREWATYENDHFIGYSDAKPKRVRELLIELEQFRAAVLQISSIRPPATAPKVRVLLVRKKADYEKLSSVRNSAAFILPRLENGPLIVLPASGAKALSSAYIRHEYTHALLRYSTFTYPRWYDEGFAELMSATEIINDGHSFTFGGIPERAHGHRGRLSFSWEELLSDDFSPHRIRDPRKGSDAYFQAWLLAHYATLGNELENTQLLQQYFDALKTGTSSPIAFERAFGVSAGDIWDQKLKEYSKRLGFYQMTLQGQLLDLEFVEVPTNTAAINPLLRALEANAVAKSRGKSPRNPMERLDGSWGLNIVDRVCRNPARFTLRAEGQQLVMDRWPGSEDYAQPLTFGLEQLARGEFELTLVQGPAAGTDSQKSRVHFKLRGPDVACLRRANWEASDCGAVLVRCED